MEKFFLPWNLALLLKEMGMKFEALGCYLDSQVGYGFQEYLYPVRRDACIQAGLEQGFSETIEAPLYDQVIDWFLEKHHLSIETGIGTSGNYYFTIMSWKGENSGWETKIGFQWGNKSRKQALDAGIKWAIELIK